MCRMGRSTWRLCFEKFFRTSNRNYETKVDRCSISTQLWIIGRIFSTVKSHWLYKEIGQSCKTGYGQLFNREFMSHRGVNRVRVRLIWKPTKSYIYDHSVMIETIASKHNLVCRQTVFNSILTSTLFVGFTVGSALGGYLSDKYGQVWIFAFETIFNNCR